MNENCMSVAVAVSSAQPLNLEFVPKTYTYINAKKRHYKILIVDRIQLALHNYIH